MAQILSPWIQQLKRDYKVPRFNDDQKTDIAIIGGGIAGIVTAYFTLKKTNYHVVLIEADKIAHGASGHNAGQIVSYFERHFSDLVKEFGLNMTAKAQQDIDSAWLLLKDIYKDTHLPTPFDEFTGYAGCRDREEVLAYLEDNLYRRQAHLPIQPLILAKSLVDKIPKKYAGLYSFSTKKNLLTMLNTQDTKYIAVISERKGVMNSALFCEELLAYMFRKYPDRFTLFEKSPVQKILLEYNHVRLEVCNHELKAQKVVLCTNGFKNFTIVNLAGDDINTKFHALIQGLVGYMAGYFEEDSKLSVAINYLPGRSMNGKEALDINPYFYLTRRTYHIKGHQRKSLVCIGGPEAFLDTINQYSKDYHYPEEIGKVIDDFLHKTYKFTPKGNITYQYFWHGLMGYTSNGIRWIGPEPINPILLYNLGCNGVGILPSIYGGKRISQFLDNELLEESIFDIKDTRRKVYHQIQSKLITAQQITIANSVYPSISK